MATNLRGSSKFRHIGEVIAIEADDTVVIALNKLAACEGCKARGKCGNNMGSEGTSSVMRVMSSRASTFEIGESVMVSISYQVGVIATMCCYIIPLILFLGVIVTLLSLGVQEGFAAAVTFIVTTLYYGGLYIMRERLESVVKFEIEKTDSL